jgi:hypothetical protein
VLATVTITEGRSGRRRHHRHHDLPRATRTTPRSPSAAAHRPTAQCCGAMGCIPAADQRRAVSVSGAIHVGEACSGASVRCLADRAIMLHRAPLPARRRQARVARLRGTPQTSVGTARRTSARVAVTRGRREHGTSEADTSIAPRSDHDGTAFAAPGVGVAGRAGTRSCRAGRERRGRRCGYSMRYKSREFLHSPAAALQRPSLCSSALAAHDADQRWPTRSALVSVIAQPQRHSQGRSAFHCTSAHSLHPTPQRWPTAGTFAVSQRARPRRGTRRRQRAAQRVSALAAHDAASAGRCEQHIGRASHLKRPTVACYAMPSIRR